MTPEPDFTVTVYGTPAPQGSKRHVGRGILVESSKRVAPWREAVKQAALAQCYVTSIPDRAVRPLRHGTLDGPLIAQMTFTLRKPTSAPKRHRTWPDRTPDLSKLIRATEDALTDAGVWADDARVVQLTARKTYPGEHPNALHIPGAIIRVWRLKEGLESA